MCASIGSVHDVRERRIPNFVTGPAILAGLILHTISGGWSGLGDSALAGLIAGGIFLIFFLAGGMGAGDVKLMAAIGALVGWQDWFGIFIATAIVGGFASMALMAMRGRVKKTLWNVGFVLTEMKSGRAAYLSNEELDVRSSKAIGLPVA